MTGRSRTIHVRITDAATGKPTPARVRFVGADGRDPAPLGRLTEFATGDNQDVGGNLLLGDQEYVLVDGSFEIALPSGPIHIEIRKGPEYTPIQREITLGAGQMALRFSLERWQDLRQLGWYSGDTRAHFLTPHGALLEAAAEDVAVVNILATECNITSPTGSRFKAIPNILAFSGQHPALESPGHLVVVNTHNQHPFLGSLGLLNCHRVVYPLTFGGPEGFDNWTLADWCDQCHRKAGLTVWTQAMQGGQYPALLADLILGRIDALELDGTERASPVDLLGLYVDCLDCGSRLALVGGSGKTSNRQALGGVRTYARLQAGEEFTYRNWIEACRAGRTFVTTGPLLTFTVNGQDPGAVLNLPLPGEKVQVRAEVHGLLDLHSLEILASESLLGRALSPSRALATAAPSGSSAILEAEISVPASGWLAARCWGGNPSPWAATVPWTLAQTSAIYLEVAGQPMPLRKQRLSDWISQMEQLLEWVQKEGRFENEAQRANWVHNFQAAKQELIRRRDR